MGTDQEGLFERLTKTVNLKVNTVKYLRRRGGLKSPSDKSIKKKKSHKNDNFERHSVEIQEFLCQSILREFNSRTIYQNQN